MLHDLKSLWTEFRKHAPDPALDPHEETVNKLDAFHVFRYPENVHRSLAGYTIITGPLVAGNTPDFHCDIDAVDALVISLHEAGSVNPKAMAMRLKPEGVEMLKEVQHARGPLDVGDGIARWTRPQRKIVEGKVVGAVARLWDRDQHLLAHDCWEAAITHRLAVYLEGEFPDRDVDCEYNRDGHDTKTLNLYNVLTDNEVRPDIIIHGRGTNARNHMVIEAKKVNGESPERDFLKLRAFRDQLGYEVIVFLLLRTDRHWQDRAQIGLRVCFGGHNGHEVFGVAPEAPREDRFTR